MFHFNPIQPGNAHRFIQRVRDVTRTHVGTKSPGDDVSRVITQYRRQVILTPTDDLEVSEIGLPKLIHSLARVLEAVSSFHQDRRRAGNQVLCLQQPVNRGFRDEERLSIGIAHGQFAR